MTDKTSDKPADKPGKTDEPATYGHAHSPRPEAKPKEPAEKSPSAPTVSDVAFTKRGHDGVVSAKAEAKDSTITKVEFFVGNTLKAVAINPPYEYSFLARDNPTGEQDVKVIAYNLDGESEVKEAKLKFE